MFLHPHLEYRYFALCPDATLAQPAKDLTVYACWPAGRRSDRVAAQTLQSFGVWAYLNLQC